MKPEINMNGFGAFAVMMLFFWLWAQSGWYRIDCALGVQKACALIEGEYVKHARP
jgi:hypothetical protein